MSKLYSMLMFYYAVILDTTEMRYGIFDDDLQAMRGLLYSPNIQTVLGT